MDKMESNGIGSSCKWKELTLEAVQEFVTSAVVIDDSPELRREESDVVEVNSIEAVADDDGLGYDADNGDIPLSESEGLESYEDSGNDHNIYIQDLTHAFQKSSIPCSFILPRETDVEEDIANDIAKAANLADILVLDWHLKNKLPVVAMSALRKIAEVDALQNGRVRLICIYTGESVENLRDIYKAAENALEDGGLSFTESNPESQKGRGEHHYLMVLQKQSVIDVDLPEKLLEAMTELANGILPSFALAAIAALRKNAHHIASRFPKELDAAYAGNRLITDPASDIDELMRSLIISDFDSAIGLERVADRMLGSERINEWIRVNNYPKNTPNTDINGKNSAAEAITIKMDKEFICGLNTGYVDGNRNEAVFMNGSKYQFNETQKSKVSSTFHDGGSVEAIKKATMNTEGKFARLVALKREAYGQSKLFSEKQWCPSLALGTLLRLSPDQGNVQYLYCLTPACDTVRLRGVDRGFVFLKLEEVNADKAKKDLIITLSDTTEVKLRINLSPWHICTYIFKGDNNIGRVMATKEEESSMFFFMSEETKLEWLGEVRHDRAMRDMAELNRAWMRLGVMDSEYLRLASKGTAPL